MIKAKKLFCVLGSLGLPFIINISSFAQNSVVDNKLPPKPLNQQVGQQNTRKPINTNDYASKGIQFGSPREEVYVRPERTQVVQTPAPVNNQTTIETVPNNNMATPAPTLPSNEPTRVPNGITNNKLDEGELNNNVETSPTATPTVQPSTPLVKPSITLNTSEMDRKASQWINGSLVNLDKSGDLKIPEWVNYNAYISQKYYAIMLSKVTKIKDRKMFGDIDENGINKNITRAMAIDSALKAFGLEGEMDRVVQNYQTKFNDITPEHKYYKACLTAEIIKLSAGYPDKTFRPDDLLKWSEAVAIVESVHRWASLMPVQTPMQKATDLKKYLWYYFLDGFRLALTAIYCIISIIFLIRSWRRAKNDRTGLREIIASLCFATICLFVMWINEMLYARGLIDKSLYYIISTISIIAGLFLLRTTNLINKQTEPKPEVNIEVAQVDYVDLSRGEIFIVDAVTKRRTLALVSKNSKVYNRENRLLGAAFFSEISAGDFISVHGKEQIAGGSVVNIDNMYILASKQNAKVTTQEKVEVIEKTYNTAKNTYKKAR